jgi:hypothetical protein
VPAGRGIELIMPPPELWAGALSLLLIHGESGCPHSAFNAARLLDRLCDSPDIDDETRALCERASSRLTASPKRLNGDPPLHGIARLIY